MAGKRRSFIRELYSLMPVLDTEYNGQIEIRPLDETNADHIGLEITPLHGYYAHASFVFSVEATYDYPFEHPTVTCLTKVLHPNIQWDSTPNNVCLNLLNYWEPHFGLKDLLHALLFLFYEPNFDDPLNSTAKPEEGLSIEETIHKSLRGELVNSIMYEPNEAWLRWVEQNSAQADSSTLVSDHPECAVDSNLCGNFSSPLRQQSTLSKYFRPALSGQYSPLFQYSWEGRPLFYFKEFNVNCLYVRQITIRSSSQGASVHDLLQDARRYYFIEQCSHSRCSFISHLGEASIRNSLLAHHGQTYASNQFANCGPWIIFPSESAISHEEAFSPGQYFFDDEEEQAHSHLYIPDGILSYADDMIMPFCVEDAAQWRTMEADCEEEQEQEEEEIPVFEEDRRETEPSVADGQENAHRQSIESVARDGNVHVPVGEHEDAASVAEEVEWIEADTADNEQTNSDVESEYEGYIEDATGLRFALENQNNSATELLPWWWIMHQSRWPVHLAPRHWIRMKKIKQKVFFARSCSTVLGNDLYRIGTKYNEPALILLVDSLSLSPLSPMLNRAVTFRGRNGRSVYWCGLDWYSLWDAMKPCTCATLSPRIHFRLPSFMFALCYMHNWLAYMSRVELYGSCLGYSRPLRPGVLSNAATTCIHPASLGCGQCSVLDMWPLWLMWRLSRHLCRLAVFLCSRVTYLEDSFVPIQMDVCFPFSDLDEI